MPVTRNEKLLSSTSRRRRAANRDRRGSAPGCSGRVPARCGTKRRTAHAPPAREAGVLDVQHRAQDQHHLLILVVQVHADAGVLDVDPVRDQRVDGDPPILTNRGAALAVLVLDPYRQDLGVALPAAFESRSDGRDRARS